MFSDLTYENISDFDLFLRRTINSQPLLYKRHSTFKSYIADAINRGMCKSNPYMLFKVPKGKDKTPTFLNEAEIKQIQDYNPVNEKVCHVKDLFIFQCFTGMAYIDLMNFSSSKVSEMEGMKVIRSSRSKTDELFVALLLPKAERIANRYNYELPKISNQKYNDYLKSLGAGAGIRKKLTTHLARHSYATSICLTNGVPIETLSQMMGHKSIKTTQIYAKITRTKLNGDMAKLEKRIEGKYKLEENEINYQKIS